MPKARSDADMPLSVAMLVPLREVVMNVALEAG
jgi:hypothetical protein